MPGSSTARSCKCYVRRFVSSPADLAEGGAVELSARNQIWGRVISVKTGTIMAEVEVEVAGHSIVAAVTRASVERLGIREGHDIAVVIKSTDVMLARP
jgi:molybdopterin-binding protein